MRMVLDFVVHMTMLGFYTRVVIVDGDAGLTKSERLLTFYVTVRRRSAHRSA